jgi:large subunit ribosomal protein L25
MTDTYPVTLRETTGKKVKRLRREGVIPANIYGRGVESVSVQIPFAEARVMLNEHGRNTLIEVQVSGESGPRSVVVRDLDREPVSGAIQHIDFFQVDLTRKLQADIPVQLIGEAPATQTWEGILVHETDSITIEALPGDLPDHFELSVEGLTELDDQLTAEDLELPSGVELISELGTVLARIARPRLEVEEEEEVLEGEELAEGEEPAEGEEAAAADGGDESSDDEN